MNPKMVKQNIFNQDVDNKKLQELCLPSFGIKLRNLLYLISSFFNAILDVFSSVQEFIVIICYEATKKKEGKGKLYKFNYLKQREDFHHLDCYRSNLGFPACLSLTISQNLIQFCCV